MKFTFPVYPITDIQASGMSHAEQTRSLVGSGIDVVQLREKRMSSNDLFEDATKALEIAKAAGIKLLVNDRVDIAIAIGADGVHLGQDDLPPEEARKLLGPEALIGYSTHSFDQAEEAASLPVDYVAIGPIFATSTKEDPFPVVGTETLARVRARIPGMPLVAIGGIDDSNIGLVSAAGADAAAAISYIFGSSNGVKQRVKSLHEQWQ